jgi:RNA polymerase sigma factor (TIGR02999 family)
MGNLQATTELLFASRAHRDDTGGARQLFEAVYEELRALAAAWLQREPRGAAVHTLQPTALVHEAYLKLIDQHRATWKDRAHFMAVASEAIRRILVDHARKRHADKRGGAADSGWQRLTIDQAGLLADRPPPDLLALDDALARLAAMHARQAEVVKLKFFGGLSGDEIAEALKIDRATVVRDWSAARAWLLAELAEDRA